MANSIRVATPVRPAHLGGILQVADVHDVGDNSRFAGGGHLVWDLNACGLMLGAPGMCEPPEDWPTAVKEDTGTARVYNGLVFGGYYGVECFYGPQALDDSAQRATQGVQDGEGVFIDQAVNTYLLTSATAGGTGTDLLDTLALADATLAVDYPVGTGVLLMSRQSAIKLHAQYALVDGPAGSGLMFTPTGTPVAALSVPVADTTMTGAIFGTGAITVNRTPIHTYDGEDLLQNKHLRIAERTYGVYFDCVTPTKFSVA